MLFCSSSVLAAVTDLPTADDVPVFLLALCCFLAWSHGFKAGITR